MLTAAPDCLPPGEIRESDEGAADNGPGAALRGDLVEDAAVSVREEELHRGDGKCRGYGHDDEGRGVQ